MAKLFLIATPIGNRQDITIRALRKLFELEVLACEDTRKTRQLLEFYKQEYKNFLGEVNVPKLISCFEYNEEQRAGEIIGMIKEGVKVGLVSNAGMPNISDPGYIVAKNCLENEIKVIVLPGANAAITALAGSGLATDKFLFLGFLPRKHGKQSKIWEELKNSEMGKTVVFYESPFRLLKVLENMFEVFGDIEVSVARELTKVYEEIRMMKISEWREEYKSKKVKGELVVMFRR